MDLYVMPNPEYLESTGAHLVEVAEARRTPDAGRPTA